ncbi:MAG TPA: site-2 protease family protein [Anaerolineales bacterium]|nr:site-2 protease family protein [Anaerolineales bacterium]
MEENITEALEAPEILSQLVARFFDINQTILGGGKYPFLVRYVGRLTTDSERAYSSLSKDLEKYEITPLFLEEKGLQAIQLMPSTVRPKRSNAWINLIFFSLTLVSMLMAGALYSYQGPEPDSTTGYFQLVWNNLASGIPFAVSLLAILLAHEFGHYLAARFHKTEVTLPYFLPFPFSPFGTLGAFIQLREPPRNKRVLLDIGIAGPLAGLIIAIPVLLIGLSLSEVSQIPTALPEGQAFSLEGNSILYLLAKFLVHGQLLPAPASFGAVSPIVYWVRYLFTGLPTPIGGMDVILHPIAWAGWAGLLVTALNLIPAGQLDGGHVLFSLFGKNARLVLPVTLVGLGVLGFFWQGWWLWVFLILVLGSSHAQPLDQITKLDSARKAIAIFGLIVFVLVFVPVPLQIIQSVSTALAP